MSSLGFVNILAWAPEQVLEWFKGLDDALQDYVPNIASARISGKHLFYLTHAELQKMSIFKLGHQEMFLEAVDLLRALHYEMETENTQTLAFRLSCKVSSLRNEVRSLNNSEPYFYQGSPSSISSNLSFDTRGKFPLQTLTLVSETAAAIKAMISWLDRAPFNTNEEWFKKRNFICSQGSNLVAAAQGDNIPVTRESFITACDNLQEICDKIVRQSRDPLVIQPVQLEVATIRKKPGDELGMHIQAVSYGVHIVEGIKEQSAADLCGKVEKGDIVVQVNYMTVVGWPLKKLVAALKENQKEVMLTLKKRPRHPPPFGPSPRKRRGSSKLKQSTFPKAIRARSKKGDRNSRSPLTEFLNVSDSLPAPSKPFSESYNLQDAATDEGEVFQGTSEVVPFNAAADDKLRRATVSGGSPVVQRASLKQRHKSSSDPPSPLSPPNSETFIADGPAPPEVRLSPAEDMKSEGSKMKAVTNDTRGHFRKVSDIVAKEIAGDARGSPRLVRITRIDSTRRPQDYVGKDGLAISEEKATSMEATSYVVNVIGGVPQRVPISPDLRQGLLRGTKKNITRRVGANRRISCKDLGYGDCQGWLWKKREDVSMLASKWVKRWCILKRNNLYYFKDKEDEKAQGMVYLPGFKISPAPEIKSRKYAFKAHHSGTTFYFASDRQDDMGKWMNKMGLAAIVFDTSMLPTTAGFRRPERVENSIPENTGYYSESEEEDDKVSTQGDTTSLSEHWTLTTPAEKEKSKSLVDIRRPTKVVHDEMWGRVYSQIQEAELNLDGVNKRRRRTSMLARSEHLDSRSSQEIQISRKLLSLERTLRDKEKELLQIERLLSEPITPEVLAQFKMNNLNIMEHIDAIHMDSSTSHSGDDTEVEDIGSDKNSSDDLRDSVDSKKVTESPLKSKPINTDL